MWKDLKVPFFTVLFIFFGFFLFSKIFGPIPFSVNSITTSKQDLFTVSGTADVTAIPDTALIDFGVTKSSPSVESAKNDVNNIINQITADIKKLGVDTKNIQTTDYSVNPNYDYTSGNQTPTGYSVSATIEVKITPIDKANDAIDIATKDGATNAGSVQFVVNDDQEKKLEDQARSEAINNAKQKAQSIATEAGIHLGRIVDVEENNDNPQPVQFGPLNEAAGLAKEATPPTQLSPGENKITSTVSLSYETY